MALYSDGTVRTDISADIYAKWLACWTQEEIGDSEGMAKGPISEICSEFPELGKANKSTQTLATYAEEGWTVLEEEAKERQQVAGGDRKSEEYEKSLGQKIDQAKHERMPKATQQAAAITGTNRQYVSDAKRISNVSWAETHFRPFLSALPRTDYKKRHPAQ